MADSLKIIFTGVGRGLKDSVVGTFKIYNIDKDLSEKSQQQQSEQRRTVLSMRREERQKADQLTGKGEPKKNSEPSVRNRILVCCAWNGGVFGLSIFMFNRAVLPCLQFLIHYFTGGTAATIWHWMGPLLTWTFSALWIIPIFILSKIVNALWFQDIADAAYRKSHGRPLLPSLQMLIADLLFSIILESVFLIQGMLAKRLLPIPGIGDLVSILHMCLLYSLYSFEYKWFNMNWPLQKRVAYIENNWPYFVGFGLPLAIMTSMADSFVISGCVFSLFFPLFIISANEAGHIHEIHDMPLMLFTPAAKVTNQLFPKLSRRATPSSGHTTPSSGHSTPAGTPKKQLHIR